MLFRLCPVPFAVSTSARQLSGCIHRPPRGASPERRGSRRAFPRPFPWELAAGLRWPRSLVVSRTRQEAEAQRGSGASGKLGSDPPCFSPRFWGHSPVAPRCGPPWGRLWLPPPWCRGGSPVAADWHLGHPPVPHDPLDPASRRLPLSRPPLPPWPRPRAPSAGRWHSLPSRPPASGCRSSDPLPAERQIGLIPCNGTSLRVNPEGLAPPPSSSPAHVAQAPRSPDPGPSHSPLCGGTVPVLRGSFLVAEVTSQGGLP